MVRTRREWTADRGLASNVFYVESNGTPHPTPYTTIISVDDRLTVVESAEAVWSYLREQKRQERDTLWLFLGIIQRRPNLEKRLLTQWLKILRFLDSVQIRPSLILQRQLTASVESRLKPSNL